MKLKEGRKGKASACGVGPSRVDGSGVNPSGVGQSGAGASGVGLRATNMSDFIAYGKYHRAPYQVGPNEVTRSYSF